MKKTYLILILILALSLTGVIFYYYQIRERTSLSDYYPKLSEGSTLVSKNDTWNVYTNERFGFTINVPKSYYAWDGACKEENGFYNVTEAEVPVVVFEDYEGVLFDRAYHAQTYANKYVADKSDLYGGSIVFNNCKIIPTNFDNLNTEVNWWKFVFSDVKSDQDLEQFIKIYYGSSCSIGEKKLSAQQSGVYDITIAGDGLDLGETNCPVNYVYKIKYYPAQNKIMSVKLGQEAKYFATDVDNINNTDLISYDDDMIDSFRFID